MNKLAMKLNKTIQSDRSEIIRYQAEKKAAAVAKRKATIEAKKQAAAHAEMKHKTTVGLLIVAIGTALVFGSVAGVIFGTLAAVVAIKG